MIIGTVPTVRPFFECIALAHHSVFVAGQQAGGLVPSCPPIGVTAVLHGGPFAASLRLLLQNDSIMEIGAHARTYGELLRLLGVLGADCGPSIAHTSHSLSSCCPAS